MKISVSVSVLLAVTLTASSAQAQQNPYRVQRTVGSNVDSSQDVDFSCQFINLWNDRRHPADFPSNPHWSAPHVISHTSDFTLFEEGGVATEGVERVAEDGFNSPLEEELDGSDDVLDHDSGPVFFLSSRRRVEIPRVTFSEESSYLSAISMIAPSPDWFSGVNGFDMVNSNTGNWYGRVVFLLYPWDAGTDAGQRYTSGDSDEDDSIHQITASNPDSLPTSGAFVRGNGNVRPVARLTCRLRTL